MHYRPTKKHINPSSARDKQRDVGEGKGASPPHLRRVQRWNGGQDGHANIRQRDVTVIARLIDIGTRQWYVAHWPHNHTRTNKVTQPAMIAKADNDRIVGAGTLQTCLATATLHYPLTSTGEEIAPNDANSALEPSRHKKYYRSPLPYQ